MTEDDPALRRAQLRAAIEAQEGLRESLGDGIVDATIAALRAQLPKDDVPQQRKLVTVLFMDVVGSTDLLRGHDPEETMAVMDSALARLAGPVHDHGGRVTRFMGDGFMAAFGLPTARENDPEMAVRTGLAIIEEAAVVAKELEATHGLEGFEVRVGVNTGLVATGGVTEAADTIMGDTVNLASRLETAAPPGTVLISHDTHQHVRDRFEFEDAGVLQAKGFPNPIRTFRVLRRTTVQEQRPDQGIEGLAIPMVGRQDQLGQLLDDFDAVQSTASLRVVSITGDAGLGKSRLLEEFRHRLNALGHLRLEARATLETRDLPYAVVRNLVERRYGIRSENRDAAARKQLVAGITADLGDPAAKTKAAFVGQLIGYDFAADADVYGARDAPQQIRSRAALYLTEVVAALAAHQPVVLVVEDLHWADSDSLDVLERIMQGLVDRPVLVVTAARPSLHEPDTWWRTQSLHRPITLEPLSPAQSVELADASLRLVVDCPEGLRTKIVERAGGNPYYLEETIRMLVDDGVIVPSDDGWTVDGDRFSEMRIPPTITGVIQARIDGLPADQRAAIQQASVVGRIFWDTLVQYLAASGQDDIDVGPPLDALDRHGMIHRRPTSTFTDSVEYVFHHEIQRSVAYEGVLMRVRRTYHSLVADWLIAARGDRGHDFSGVIAGHLDLAGRHDEALDHYDAAAQAALAAYAIDAADRFLERALALLPEEDRDRRFTLLLGREKTLGARGLHEQQRAVIDELAAMVGDDPVAATEVELRRVWSHYYAGEYPQAVDAGRTAVSSAARTSDEPLMVRALATFSTCLLAVGDVDAARRSAEDALARAVSADDEKSQDRAHNTLGLIMLVSSEFSAAREHLAATVRSARKHGDLEREIIGTSNLGVVEARLGNYPAARKAFERAVRMSAEVGDRLMRASGLVNLAWVASSEGDWGPARDLAEQATREQRAIGHRDAVAESLMWLGFAHLGVGATEEAQAAFDEALQIRQELGQTALAVEARAGMARTALTAGDLDTALARVREITDHMTQGGSLAGTWEPLRILLTCAQVLSAAGEETGPQLLAQAHELLLSESERITNPDDRRTFLEQVPWHREIVALAAALEPPD